MNHLEPNRNARGGYREKEYELVLQSTIIVVLLCEFVGVGVGVEGGGKEEEEEEEDERQNICSHEEEEGEEEFEAATTVAQGKVGSA